MAGRDPGGLRAPLSGDTPRCWLDGLADVRRDETLARHTQYGIGGPAQWFARVNDRARLAELLRGCHDIGVPVTILGAGSNALIGDAGIRGLVVKMTDRRLRLIDDGMIELSGGYMMPRAALDCAKQGYAGMEFGIGIPGTCGASVMGNAGAFGREMSDVLVDCDALTPGGAGLTLAAADCGFGYRDSRFKQDLAGHVVVAARLIVHRDDPVKVRRRTDRVQADRKASQPIGLRSLGSVFKNPPGDFAGRLIQAAGLRGRRLGGAQIAPTHANFILNLGSATAADVLGLIALAHDTVLERFGIDLEREIALVGDHFHAGAGVGGAPDHAVGGAQGAAGSVAGRWRATAGADADVAGSERRGAGPADDVAGGGRAGSVRPAELR
ncbi:MAG: UDP-N-acetylmuramate dehydrogenase [Candidatus Dormibacteria bacterium]